MDYRKKLAWLIAVSTLCRIIIAWSLELGNTEAYYWVLSNRLQLNYFDHPPMVAWLIRLTTLNGALHHELFVRLGAIIAAGICTWLIYRLGSVIHSARAGWFAAVLYTTSIYATMGAGIYIIPDSPQMIFWLASLIVLVKLMNGSTDGRKSREQWCLFGLLTGLCIMSKVHGAVIWAGALAYMLVYDRQKLKDPFVYVSLAITLVIISPIIIWNIDHNFAAYKYHSGRVDLTQGQIDPVGFVKMLVKVIISTGPIHYVLIVIAVLLAFKGKLGLDQKAGRVLLLCNLPLVILILVISLFRETMSHWPGPPLSALLVLPAVWLAGRLEPAGGKLLPVLKIAVAYAIFMGAVEALTINYLPGTTSVAQGMRIGADDATVDMYGWKHAGETYDSVYRAVVAKHLIDARAPVIVTSWVPAAHVDYYITSRTGQETFALGNIDSLHQYYWLNDDKRHLRIGDDAWYVIPSNMFDYQTFNKLTASFNSFAPDLMFSQYRSGMVCKRFYIFRLIGYKGDRAFK
ncbi:MAG TPA: glycosyltransferase family 39 protein [Mucilaginibacter sp.]|nr:glycosyltransferase family 39 protein [Mucilaginibacter sp.]